MSELFGPELQLLAKSLDMRAKRNKLIVTNLANADTPGYKAVKIQFEETLNAMIESGGSKRIRTTHAKHFPTGGGNAQREPEIEIRQETSRRDGNSVDMDEELVDLMTNQIIYNANIEALSRISKLIKYAISEGGGF